jgi:hypothetical protein
MGIILTQFTPFSTSLQFFTWRAVTDIPAKSRPACQRVPQRPNTVDDAPACIKSEHLLFLLFPLPVSTSLLEAGLPLNLSGWGGSGSTMHR